MLIYIVINKIVVIPFQLITKLNQVDNNKLSFVIPFALSSQEKMLFQWTHFFDKQIRVVNFRRCSAVKTSKQRFYLGRIPT